jgi:hypothetical protein
MDVSELIFKTLPHLTQRLDCCGLGASGAQALLSMFQVHPAMSTLEFVVPIACSLV